MGEVHSPLPHGTESLVGRVGSGHANIGFSESSDVVVEVGAP